MLLNCSTSSCALEEGFIFTLCTTQALEKQSILNSVLYWINITCKCLYYTVGILIPWYCCIISNKVSLSTVCLNARHAVVFKAHWSTRNASAAVINPIVWIKSNWYYIDITHVINILKVHRRILCMCLFSKVHILSSAVCMFLTPHSSNGFKISTSGVCGFSLQL